MKRKKKAHQLPFSLIEILISFCLISIATVGLYWMYTISSLGTSTIEKQLLVERELLSKSRKVRHYLTSILLAPIEIAQGRKIVPFFYTEGENDTPHFRVYASIDNEEGAIPALSNEVIGTFYIDEAGLFTLAITPHPIRSTAQIELLVPLFSDIETIFWEFALWPTSHKSSAPNEPPEGIWISEWKKEWMKTPPELIRITLSLKNGTTKKITSVQTKAISKLSLH